VTKLLRRQRSVDAGPLPPSCCARWSPSPALRAGADKQERSRDAFFAPEPCQRHSQVLCLHIKEGRRSADRRTGRIRTGTSDEHIRTRGQCGERHDRSALPRTSRLRAPSPFGAPSRHSPGCYLWLSFGLRLPESALARAATTPFTSELLAPRSLCRRGRVRSRPGAVCETARRRRSSLHQPDRLALTPLMSELEPYNQV
jgi:hypothetical protein